MASDKALDQALQNFGQAEALLQHGKYAAARPLYEQILLALAPHLETAPKKRLLQQTEACLEALAMIASQSVDQNLLVANSFLFNAATWPSQLLHPWSPQIQATYYISCINEISSRSISPSGLTQLAWILQQLRYQHGLLADDDHEYQAHLLEEQAWQAQEQADYAQAQGLLQQALELREHHNGPQHLGHISVLTKLAKLASLQGQGQQLFQSYQRILLLARDLLGEQHMILNMALMEFMNAAFATRQPLKPEFASMIHRVFGAETLYSFELQQQQLINNSQAPMVIEQPQSAELQQLLADIEAVAWHKLKHSMGSTTEMPELLWAFLSDDQQDCDIALEIFHNLLWVKGSEPLPIVATLLPFLWRIVASGQVFHPRPILQLLAAIADTSRSMPNSKARQAIRHELVQGVPILLQSYRQLTNSDALIISILSLLPEAAEQTVPTLKTWLHADDLHAGTHAVILVAMAELLDHDQSSVAFFEQQLQQAEHPACAFVAAIAITARMGAATADQVVNVIVSWLQQVTVRPEEDNEFEALLQIAKDRTSSALATNSLPELLFDLFEQAAELEADWTPEFLQDVIDQLDGPFWQELGVFAAVEALTLLGGQRATPLLSSLLTQSAYDAPIVYFLLKMVFGQPAARYVLQLNREEALEQQAQPLRTDLTFTPNQRVVLLALVENPACWQITPDTHPLRWFGLPTNQDLLRHILLETPNASKPPQIPADLLNPPPIKELTPKETERRHKAVLKALLKHRWSKLYRSDYEQITNYLREPESLSTFWKRNKNMELHQVEHGMHPILSTGENLDTLDLRILELYALYDRAWEIISLLATQKRVAQAFAHLKQLKQQYPRLRNLRAPVRALALARAPLVQDGQPTPLGWLLLEDFPERLKQTVLLRDVLLNAEYSKIIELVELLMAHPEPYVQEAFSLLHEYRRYV